jgi:serine acetyltransferase
VGNGVYIAAGAIVLGNIKIGDGVIINAGSVVTKPVEPYSRVGGVPGRVIAKFEFTDTSPEFDG